MFFFSLSRLWARLLCLALPALLVPSAFAGKVSITSPTAGSSGAGLVSITASAAESEPFHLEVWDNGNKLGDVLSNAVNSVSRLAEGPHTTTILAVSKTGYILDGSSVSYKVTAANAPGAVSIASPIAGSISINAVRIAASANQSGPFHLEIWDNGAKLGEVAASAVDGVYVLPNGSHILTVQAVLNDGSVVSKSSVNYRVAENCADSSSAQCDLDQQQVDDIQGNCDPEQENMWVANPCGPGIQGDGGVNPENTGIEAIAEGGLIPDQGSLTLNGRSLHLVETQGGDPSNVLFRAESPAMTQILSADSHWALDEYVYLPDPTAHQAFEMDAQYSINGIWTKFYTECAFNMNAGTGYWAVFDTETGGWIFLNGQSQNGQTPPAVPCNRSQFSGDLPEPDL